MRLLLLVSIFALLFGACSNNMQHIETIKREHKGLMLIDIPKDIIQSYNTRINANGLLEIEIILKSARQREVIYKIDWLDSDGFVLQDVFSEEYKTLTILKNRETIIRKIASDVRAKDFAIEIRPN